MHAGKEAVQLLTRGIARRHTGETKNNSASSRSHCVVTATLESRLVEDGVTSFRTSRLHLVDLAGGPLPLAAGCPPQLRVASAISALLSSPARASCSLSWHCCWHKALTLQAASGSWLLKQKDSS